MLFGCIAGSVSVLCRRCLRYFEWFCIVARWFALVLPDCCCGCYVLLALIVWGLLDFRLWVCAYAWFVCMVVVFKFLLLAFCYYFSLTNCWVLVL